MLRLVFAALLLALPLARADTAVPILQKEISIDAALDAVWNAWTTEAGLAFISPKSNVELRIGGPYEWFLHLDADDRGKRGGEGSHILAYLPRRMIAFSWTFPPTVPELRYADERTQVIVLLDEIEGRVRLTLYAHGWQEGEPWKRGWDYFDQAWELVLERMKSHLERQHEEDMTD